jgi:hypothetical protein
VRRAVFVVVSISGSMDVSTLNNSLVVAGVVVTNRRSVLLGLRPHSVDIL